MNNIDAKITAWQLGPVTIMRGTATPGRDVTHPECFGRFTVVALSYGGGGPQVHAPRRPNVRQALRMRTARPAGGTGVRVTEGVRKIIVEWHGKGVPPEETARSLRIPIDEVKAIILQAHPAPAPEKPAGIGDNRRES